MQIWSVIAVQLLLQLFLGKCHYTARGFRRFIAMIFNIFHSHL